MAMKIVEPFVTLVPQMRQIAEMIRAELLKISKVCFEDIPFSDKQTSSR